jgi:uncharacterized membrane protein (UPF0127 family)
MFAKPLDKYEVAFFIFPREDQHSFWNKNVDFPLSLAFLDRNFKIVDIKDMDEQSTKSCSPKSNNVKYVVEANKNTFEDLKIGIGDKLILDDNKIKLKRYF